jgi:DNA-binding Xre family transcriptional regulator
MLAKLVNEKLRLRGISVRSAAEELGVSHTTIHRILKNENVDLDTVIKMCDWLGVRPSTLLDASSRDNISDKVAAIIQVSPGLSKLFTEMVRDFEDGKMSERDIMDVLSYASYKLRLREPTNSSVHEEGR